MLNPIMWLINCNRSMNNRWIYLQQLDLVGETFFLLKYLFNQYNVEGEVVEVNNSCAKPNLRDAF
jgi:hypothetical protein